MSLLRDLIYRLPRDHALSKEVLEGMDTSQKLAYSCAKAIAGEMKEGWTEAQTARLMDVYLQDHGVRNVFHKSFAWFGERSRFDGMRRWRDFLPSSRRLKPEDCVILDTAPVFNGFPADIGYPCSLKANADLDKGRAFLTKLRGVILELFDRGARDPSVSGGDICQAIARHIRQAGFDVVHHRYPGGVLGHRLHPMSEGWRPPAFMRFGWGVFTRFLYEGVFPELLNEAHRGDLEGAWAIEPHFGGKGFGCKFEEVMVVDKQGARWLSPKIPWS